MAPGAHGGGPVGRGPEGSARARLQCGTTLDEGEVAGLPTHPLMGVAFSSATLRPLSLPVGREACAQRQSKSHTLARGRPLPWAYLFPDCQIQQNPAHADHSWDLLI